MYSLLLGRSFVRAADNLRTANPRLGGLDGLLFTIQFYFFVVLAWTRFVDILRTYYLPTFVRLVYTAMQSNLGP